MIPKTFCRFQQIVPFNATVAFLLLGACDHKLDCFETKTCARLVGTGGQATAGQSSGGAGGAGGSPALHIASGGSLPATEGAGASGVVGSGGCTKALDCSDGKFCTGEEKCDQGKCVAGSDPCSNPDAAHCAVACDEASAKCIVTANDADGDKHLTSLCAAAPGDDCDDTKNTVYPGNTEICDGLDNDCDGKYDFAEGFALGGTEFVLEANAQSLGGLVWLPQRKSYAAVWWSASDSRVYVTEFDLSGNKVGVPVYVDSVDPSTYFAPKLYGVAWGNDHFGVLYSTQPKDPLKPTETYWSQIYPPTRQGPRYPVSATIAARSIPLMAREWNGPWDVLWNEGTDTMVQGIAPADMFGTPSSGGPTGTPRALFHNSQLLGVGTSEGSVDVVHASPDGKLNWDRMVGNIGGCSTRLILDQVDPTTTIFLGQVRLSDAANALTATWATNTVIPAQGTESVLRLKSFGAKTCTNNAVWKGSDEGIESTGLDRIPSGWATSLLLGADLPGQRPTSQRLLLTAVAESCDADIPQQIAAGRFDRSVAQAAGPDSLAIAWVSSDTLRVRIFGSLLCSP